MNHVNDLGWTALLETVILGKGTEPWQQIVRILLAAGADRRSATGTASRLCSTRRTVATTISPRFPAAG